MTGAPKTDQKKGRVEKILFSENTPNAKPATCIGAVSSESE